MDKCLLCYGRLEGEGGDFHRTCARALFHGNIEARLPFALTDIDALAKESVLSRIAVTGVQKKLSLHPEGDRGGARRLTIPGYKGLYILKPPTADYPELPELEDATMHMAELCGITVVPHGLIRLSSGEPAYITRRVDRTRSGDRIHMEDLCQISGRLTEHKYRASAEQAGKLIYRHSSAPGLDRIHFLELLLFCFLTGNADMHLKNFSMIHTTDGYRLAPAYDLLPTTLLLPSDDEESALPIDGRKKRLDRGVFLRAAATLGIPARAAENAIAAMLEAMPGAIAKLRRSFVSNAMREKYEELIQERSARLS